MHTVWFSLQSYNAAVKSEIVRIHLAELHLKAFKSVLVFEIHLASFYLWQSQEATTASHTKPQKKDRKMPEVTASLAALGNVSLQ